VPQHSPCCCSCELVALLVKLLIRPLQSILVCSHMSLSCNTPTQPPPGITPHLQAITKLKLLQY
jgi:hypothetical protein